MRPRPITIIVAIMISGVIGGLSYCQSEQSYARVQVQIAKLRSQHPARRGNAVLELGRMGAQAAPALPYLRGLLGDNTRVWKGLDPGPSPWERKTNTTVGREAALAISKIERELYLERAAQQRQRAAQQGESASRQRKALTELAAREYEALIAALESPVEEVRRQAARALVSRGDPRAAEVLLEDLHEEDKPRRYEAAIELSQLGDKRAVEILLEALRDKDSDEFLRYKAIQGLGRLKDERAITFLIQTLGDENPGIRNTTARTLMGMTGQNFGQDRAKWEEWARERGR